jgi:RNase H-like domain found in reverse transcriptase
MQVNDVSKLIMDRFTTSTKSPELNYSPTDGELLAIVWAIETFRPYLYGVKFTIITYHKALKWLLSTRNLTGKLTRYAIKLQEFDFHITHRSGASHGNVDGLSRIRQCKYSLSSTDSPPAVKCYTVRVESDKEIPATPPRPVAESRIPE